MIDANNEIFEMDEICSLKQNFSDSRALLQFIDFTFFCLRKKFPGAFHDISIDRPKAISAFNDLKDKKTFQRRTFRLYYDFTSKEVLKKEIPVVL